LDVPSKSTRIWTSRYGPRSPIKPHHRLPHCHASILTQIHPGTGDGMS
jgi:hypothetical protein